MTNKDILKEGLPSLNKLCKTDGYEDLNSYLNQRAKMFFCCVDCVATKCDGNCSYQWDMIEWLVHNCGAIRYWLVLHDLEKNEDGTPCLLHWHFLLEYAAPVRCSSVFLSFYDFFNVDSVIANDEGKPILNPWLNVKKCHNDIGALRYLCHLDEDPEKKEMYPLERVITNDKYRLYGAAALNGSQLTVDNLIYLYVTHCNFSKVRLMQCLGLRNYKRVMCLLKDIEEDLNVNVRLREELKGQVLQINSSRGA